MRAPIPRIDPAAVHRPTSVLLWCLVAASAGAVNAGSLLACQSFVSHVTGTITRIGVDVSKPTLMLEYGAVLASFLVGAFATPWVLRVRAGRFSGLPLALSLVCALLCASALLGCCGFFGGFGTGVETPRDFALLVLLSLAMGVQNGTLSAVTRNQVRSTHLTGTATDLALLTALALHPDAGAPSRRELLRDAALRVAHLFAFALGAFSAVALSQRGYLLFFAPALLLAVSSLLSAAWMRAEAQACVARATFRHPIANARAPRRAPTRRRAPPVAPPLAQRAPDPSAATTMRFSPERDA